MPNNRLTLMANIMSFLMPGVNGRGIVALSGSAYTLPSVATIEVGDDDLAGQGATMVAVRSTSDTNGLLVGLRETTLKGLFRGQVEIVSYTNPPTLGRLRAREGGRGVGRVFRCFRQRHCADGCRRRYHSAGDNRRGGASRL